MKFNKFEKRKLSNFYVQTPYVVKPDEKIDTTSNKTKLIATSLMRFNYNTLTISPLTISRPFFDWFNGNTAYLWETVDLNVGFFNIYVFQDMVNDGRSITIEFLSIDAVTIPFPISSKNLDGNWIYFIKKNNSLSELTTIPRVDSTIFTEFVPIGGFLQDKAIKKNHTSVDIIRLYNNRTCDVFKDNIKTVTSTYEASKSNNRKKAFYFKLNKS